jgi:hypothetical protein
MSRLLAVAIVLLGLLFAPAAQAANEPIVRVRVETAAPYAVGQPIAFEIQILAPNYFLSAPGFPTLDIPGAVVTQDDRALNFTETIGGTVYSGIRTGYSIVPQQPGSFALPPARIEFTYAAVPGQSTPGSVTVPVQTFEVAAASGASAPVAFTIAQSFDRDIAGLKAGDAVTRTITIDAPGRPAMTIPPPRIDPAPGAKLYRHDPVLSDERQDGRRTETVTYAFPEAGDYALPPVTLGVAGVPEVRVHIAASGAGAVLPPEPAAGLSRLDEVDWRLWSRIAFVVVLAALAVAVSLWCWRELRAAASRHRQSERAYFARVVTACRTGDGLAAYRALQAWSSRVGTRPLDDWASRFGGSALQAEIRRLEDGLFGPAATQGWSTRPLGTALAAARQRWRAVHPAVRRHALPALN